MMHLDPLLAKIHYFLAVGMVVLLRHDIKSLTLSVRDGLVIIFKNGKDHPPTE